MLCFSLSSNAPSFPLAFQEGFDALDPFVPILVPNYTEREFESCYRYYLHCRWLQHDKGECPPQGLGAAARGLPPSPLSASSLLQRARRTAKRSCAS